MSIVQTEWQNLKKCCKAVLKILLANVLLLTETTEKAFMWTNFILIMKTTYTPASKAMWRIKYSNIINIIMYL